MEKVERERSVNGSVCGQVVGNDMAPCLVYDLMLITFKRQLARDVDGCLWPY